MILYVRVYVDMDAKAIAHVGVSDRGFPQPIDSVREPKRNMAVYEFEFEAERQVHADTVRNALHILGEVPEFRAGADFVKAPIRKLVRQGEVRGEKV